MAKELRITFKDSELELYNYIKSKSSPSAFLKDLAAFERKREDALLTGAGTTNSIAKTIDSINIGEVTETKSIEELDISDLPDF